MASTWSNVLALSHIAVGASSLLAPLPTLRFFQLHALPQATFIGRLFGSRDLVLGLSIWTSSEASLLSRALLAANIVNAIDTGSALLSYFNGDSPEVGALAGAVGAAVLTVIGLVGAGRVA